MGSKDHALRWGHTTELPDEVIGTAYREGFPGRIMSIRFDIDRARLYAFSC